MLKVIMRSMPHFCDDAWQSEKAKEMHKYFLIQQYSFRDTLTYWNFSRCGSTKEGVVHSYSYTATVFT